MPTIQVLQDVQTRLERGGGGGTDREQRGRNEGGREKCASWITHNIISRPACMGVSAPAVTWQFILDTQMYMKNPVDSKKKHIYSKREDTRQGWEWKHTS